MATRKQGNTRQQIIAAAYQLLADTGYEAASIKEIARAAGVAPGLVHYYFGSKEALLVAVLKEASDRYTAEMQTLAASLPPDGLATAALQEPRDRVARRPEWYRLRYDLFALGLRNPAIAEGVAALLANGRAGVAEMVRRSVGEGAVESEAAAAVLLACFDGLALQQLADPGFDLAAAYRALARMMESLTRAT